MAEIRELKARYDAKLHENFRELIEYGAEKYNTRNAFIIKHKINRKECTYEYKTFADVRDDVNAFGSKLLSMGLKDKRIAIIGKNRYEWFLTYLSTLCGLGISVPLDKGLPLEEAESSIIRSFSDVIVFDKDHLNEVQTIKENGNTKLECYICMDELDESTKESFGGQLFCMPNLIKEGYEIIKSGNTEYMELPVDRKKSTIILFTSGTTSMSKAVLLSQYNITSNVYGALQAEQFLPGDINMAFLPYHHTFGSTGQMVMLASGITTAYCDGLKYLQKNIVEYKVSVFVCVPLLIESIYKKVMAEIRKQGKEKTVERGIKLSKFLLKFGIDARRKIFKDIHEKLGGNLRFVISGASAIDPEALEGFINFGIDAVQGYGMTESAPIIAAESPQERKTGSIGRALPGVQVKIVDKNEEGIGELIAKGPNVMEGYYENPEETAKVIDEDGWLHTGDLASVDEDGFIFIRGRKKNVIVLKNGKNVYPEELEVLVSNLPYVSEVMVYGQPKHNDGDEKDLAIGLKIVYNKEYMNTTLGISDSEEIEKYIKADIDKINEDLPVYKQMLRLIVTDEPMIKTTTGKVKRFEEAKNL